jgi:NADP-dependent aldehyde dehydrogenase
MTGAAPAATTADQLEAILAAASAARADLGAIDPDSRAEIMRACGVALLGEVDELVELAAEETNLSIARLRGEVARTAYQFQLYGDAIRNPRGVAIDLPDPDATPAPRPDLRRTTRPIGVVLVFAASNFPFAFSVAGTDTAAAFAAGCPVIAKAHSGHPRTSQAVAEIIRQTLEGHGCPPGAFAVIFGTEQGVAALKDPRVGAASFTGSLAGGRRLFDIAHSRPVPIPFYGELGSLNPVIVAPAIAAQHGESVADAFFASFTLGSGQFCTKPGLVFWPDNVDIPATLTASVDSARPAPLLNARIASGYEQSISEVRSAPGVRVIARAEGSGEAPEVVLFETDAATLATDPDRLLIECFGPAALVVRYSDAQAVVAALAGIDGALTGTVHAVEADDAFVEAVLPSLEERVGRIVWRDWPTGVAVAHAQHHGGPYPATTSSLHTSVGTAAIDRFLRPIVYQNVPSRFLPAELRAG